MLTELLVEVRGPVLLQHPLFKVICNGMVRLLRRLCHEAVGMLTPAPGEYVFMEGDVCSHMHFVVSGPLRYIAHPTMAIGQVMTGHTTSWEEARTEKDGGE